MSAYGSGQHRKMDQEAHGAGDGTLLYAMCHVNYAMLELQFL